MKRREFITLLGGAAATWPLAARAQQGERVRRIGVLSGLGENDPQGRARIGAFQEELQKLGWTLGRNIELDVRWAGASAESLQTMSAELVKLTPDVILASPRRDPHDADRVADHVGRALVELNKGRYSVGARSSR